MTLDRLRDNTTYLIGLKDDDFLIQAKASLLG